jgi:hypothetical protein
LAGVAVDGRHGPELRGAPWIEETVPLDGGELRCLRRPGTFAQANPEANAGLRAWVAEKGIDAKTFQAAFESFDVDVRLKRSDQLVRDYKVDAVPMIAVAGRYAVTGQAVKGQSGLLRIADELADYARATFDGAFLNSQTRPNISFAVLTDRMAETVYALAMAIIRRDS